MLLSFQKTGSTTFSLQQFQPPNGRRWTIIAVHLKLATGGTAGNRQLVFYISNDNGGGEGYTLADTGVVVTESANFSSEMGPTTGAYVHNAALGTMTTKQTTYEPHTTAPEAIQGIGPTLNLDATNLQVGDAYDWKFTVEETQA